MSENLLHDACGETEEIVICSECEKHEPTCDGCGQAFANHEKFICDGHEWHYCDKSCREKNLQGTRVE